MSTLEQIEAAIESLPREEFFRLHEWIRDRFDDKWDKQIEEDVRSGRLNSVTQEALAEYRAGRSKPFLRMKSRAVASFWIGYNRLPTTIQKLAVKQYRLWLDNPRHPSVRFKKVGSHWSARITDDYRTVGIMEGDTIIWFFVGTHAEYIQILKDQP